MKIASITLALLTILITSCTNYGAKYEADKNTEIYYKEGVDEPTAKKFGDYISRTFPSTTRRSFQLTKSKDTFNVRMVVDKEKLKTVGDESFMALGMLVSDSVVNGKPVNVELCDDTFNAFKTIRQR